MSPEVLAFAKKLAEGARAKVDEEEKRIDAIIAARKSTEKRQPQ